MRRARQAVKDALQQQATQKEYRDAVHKAVVQMMNSGEVAGEPVQDVANTGNGGRMEGKTDSTGKNRTELNPYSNIPDGPKVGEGKSFTMTQKNKIIAQNMANNSGIVKSDLSGEVLVKPQKSTLGVTPDPMEWQIDHVKPKNKGGSNSYSNAQVLSRKENRFKSDK